VPDDQVKENKWQDWPKWPRKEQEATWEEWSIPIRDPIRKIGITRKEGLKREAYAGVLRLERAAYTEEGVCSPTTR
jgi:hypothetical protein